MEYYSKSIRASAFSFSRAVFVIIVLCMAGSVFAQPGEEALKEARKLMAMEPKAAQKYIADLSPEKATNLVSQVRFLARKKNPDLDKVYYLVQHLETLKATALAQKRLNNLLLVLGLTLVLFTVFLSYVILDQRRTMMRLKEMIGNRPAETSSGTVYRGE